MSFCPLLKGDCIESRCSFWTHILGQEPQTGRPLDHFDCAVKWIPVLLIENGSEMRKTASAVDSFRNSMIVQNNSNLEVLRGSGASVKLEVLGEPTKNS